MEDIDLYRCANILLKRYGEAGAELHACLMADALDAAGAEQGARVWLRIIAALDYLVGKMQPGDVLH